MTNADSSDMFVQFQVPGYPYSVVRFPLSGEWVATAVGVAQALAHALDEAFPQSDAPAYEEPQQRPQERAQPQQQNEAAAYCPEHGKAPMRPSAPQYNKDGDKFYHALIERDFYRNQKGDTVKNHTLYWRQTVDANGESNDGKFMPGAQPQRRPVAAGRSDEPPPYGDHEQPW